MDEKTFKKMRNGGALSLVIGIIAIVTGVISGTLLIINGAKLIAHKPENLF